LKVLGSAGLVRHEAVGTRHVYRVRTEGLASLRAELDAFWGEALSAFAELVDEEEGVS
jgi:hypothetical protein